MAENPLPREISGFKWISVANTKYISTYDPFVHEWDVSSDNGEQGQAVKPFKARPVYNGDDNNYQNGSILQIHFATAKWQNCDPDLALL